MLMTEVKLLKELPVCRYFTGYKNSCVVAISGSTAVTMSAISIHQPISQITDVGFPIDI
jgi:hypothetical protein